MRPIERMAMALIVAQPCRILCICRRVGLSRLLAKTLADKEVGSFDGRGARDGFSRSCSARGPCWRVHAGQLAGYSPWQIVTDAYYAPFAPNIRHDLRSVTKSFIGTLTAIEVQEGLLDSVDHTMIVDFR
jgi:hypothetical protein